MDNTLTVLNKADTYSMALLMLYLTTDNPKYSTLSELTYVLDIDNFKNIVKYFGGQTITIPTAKEIEEQLKILMLFQYSRVEKINWSDALKMCDVSAEDSMSYKTKVDRFCSALRKHRYMLGGVVRYANNER